MPAWAAGAATSQASAPSPRETTASSSVAGFAAEGAIDGKRFATDSGSVWKGKPGQTSWWWQARFDPPRNVGAILQIVGDQDHLLRDAPKRYVWQSSPEGQTWQDLEETRTARERRLFRIHRLATAKQVRYLRLNIQEATGDNPSLREVEFYPQTDSTIDFPDWIIVVSTTVDPKLPGPGEDFIRLARLCNGWEHTPAQQIWKGDFDEAFASGEPRPLCAFLSGNFKDWCEQPREPWRGTQEVLTRRNLPIWAACGGAQALAILSTVGVDRPWDCPRCRDPKDPKLPIYTHIGHTGPAKCGDYSKNVFERGIYNVLQVRRDPVFDRLPRQFKILESHCGQIEYVPEGWSLVVTRGQGAKTRTQCMRVNDRYIYAAQFHMETFDRTLDASRAIMMNFLSLAKQWGGYNPQGKPVPVPRAIPPIGPAPTPTRPDAPLRIVVIGDSTVADYPLERPIRGWGQMLPEFFADKVRVINLARSGRSSRSFIREGLWDRALTQHPDIVLIQFGHNDCPGKGDRETDPNSTFMDYLRVYIDDARYAGADPVLITPMTRRTFNPDGTIRTILRPYADAMIKVGGEKSVPVIDLHAKSVKLFQTLGDAGSAKLSCSPGDRTHFSPEGARAMAKLIVEDLPKAAPALRPYLR